MNAINITVDQFKTDFSEFTDLTDNVIESFINQGYCYISNNNYGVIKDNCRILAIELMTAHLLSINEKASSGQNIGQIASSSIDSISVSMTPPPNKNDFTYWLGTTPYGMRLLGLLSMKSGAGLYFGGSKQRVLR